MPYLYLDDVATADVAFQASGRTMEELFIAAADATLNVMIEDLESIADRQRCSVSLENDSPEMLLLNFLQEIIYHKDAEELLLRFKNVVINRRGDQLILTAQAYGENLNRQKHRMRTDVKAVTLHRLSVQATDNGWEATVVLDV